MRKLAVLLSATVATALLSALAIPALAATKSIKVGDDFFVKDGTKPTITVKRGTTVRWRFVGDSPHNVTVKSGPVKFASKTMDSGSFAKKLTKTGTYKIYCTIHGAAVQSMTLKVRK